MVGAVLRGSGHAHPHSSLAAARERVGRRGARGVGIGAAAAERAVRGGSLSMRGADRTPYHADASVRGVDRTPYHADAVSLCEVLIERPIMQMQSLCARC